MEIEGSTSQALHKNIAGLRDDSKMEEQVNARPPEYGRFDHAVVHGVLIDTLLP